MHAEVERPFDQLKVEQKIQKVPNKIKVRVSFRLVDALCASQIFCVPVRESKIDIKEQKNGVLVSLSNGECIADKY